MKKLFLIILLVISQLAHIQAQQKFENLDELLAFADTKNISIKSNNIRLLQAKKTLLASKLAIADPLANINSSFTDNTRLPVNLFPAEIFGGQKGEFREIQTGVQYNTNSNQNLDIKLLNLEGWQNFKLSEINIQISENDVKVTQKNLHDNIASAYYNIVQLYAQMESTKQNLMVSDTLLALAERKYKQGIVKQQDVNDAIVNQLTIKESINQIEFLLKQNYLTLKILSDIPESETIEILERINTTPITSKPMVMLNNLLVESNRLKELSALTTIQKTKRAFAPTVSFVASNSFNQYNNDFTLFGGKWITSNYVGLKLNFALPNANTLTNKFKAQYDYQLAQKNTEQAQIKADLTVSQLETDWEKALSQTKNYEEIIDIQRDTYNKNKNLYNEGLISIDRVLNSFNALTNAIYSLNSSKVSISLAQVKIDINNKIK
jgi:outer membrane protein TolC